MYNEIDVKMFEKCNNTLGCHGCNLSNEDGMCELNPKFDEDVMIATTLELFKDIQQQIKWNEEHTKARVILSSENEQLKAQNEVMKEALESIRDYWNGGSESAVNAIEEAISMADAALSTDKCNGYNNQLEIPELEVTRDARNIKCP